MGRDQNTSERVQYKSPNDGEFFIYAEVGETEKYRKDQGLALVNVLQSFTVFETQYGGGEGMVMRPSKSKLQSAFGTEEETEILKTILMHGKISISKDMKSQQGHQ